MDEQMTPRFDLHSHSVYSDGSNTPAQSIEEAARLGLAGLAITDHDSLTQLSDVRRAAREADFPVLAGTEVSSWNPETGRKVHILAFGLEATPDGSGPLELMLAETLRARTANTLWQAWVIWRAMHAGDDPASSLAASGCADPGRVDAFFSPDAACRVAGVSTGVYKQHVMEALLHLPYTDSASGPIYRSLFKGEGIACHDISYPSAVDAVRAVREQGGVPVLAHPGQMDSWSAIPGLVEAGLMGIEAHHPDHGGPDVEAAREAAEAHGLFVTGGSDYHGRYGAPRRLGCCFVDASEAGDAVAQLFERERSLS